MLDLQPLPLGLFGADGGVLGYYCQRNQQDHEGDGPGEEMGWTAKRAAHVYTGEKTQGPPGYLPSRPSASAGETARARIPKAELPGRGLGGSLQERAGARSVQVSRARARRGKGPGGV